MEQERYKALIRKFKAGNCTPEEMEHMRLFLQSPVSQELFDQILDEDWQEPGKGEASSDAYIKNFQQRFEKRIADTAVQVRPLARRFSRLSYAAVWIFMVLGAATYGLWRLNKKNAEPAHIVMLSSHNPDGRRSTIMLSDSSVITLGAGSTLRYPEGFAGGSREVSLEGEAFFQVKRNPDKPFIIHTGQVRTRVLGTSFKIDAFKGQNMTVAVATGKVMVERKAAGTGKTEPLAVLLPGDEVEWNTVTEKAFIGHRLVEEVTGWQKGRLTFSGTPLTQVAQTLGRWYNVKIDIRNKATGKYKMNLVVDVNRPLVQSLEILKATIKADYTVKANHIIIR